MATKTYKIKGMDCDACAKMIELDLEDAGISASCSYQKEEITINENEVPFEKIQKVVENGGYQLDKKLES